MGCKSLNGVMSDNKIMIYPKPLTEKQQRFYISVGIIATTVIVSIIGSTIGYLVGEVIVKVVDYFDKSNDKFDEFDDEDGDDEILDKDIE